MLIENKCLGEKRKKKVKSFGFERCSSFLFILHEPTMFYSSDKGRSQCRLFVSPHILYFFFIFTAGKEAVKKESLLSYFLTFKPLTLELLTATPK